MFKLMQKLREKRGSEIIQTLIIIAVLGAAGVLIIGGMSDKLKNKNDAVMQSIDNSIGQAVNQN